MFRVYNIEEKKWVKDNIYMSTNGDLYTLINNNKVIFNADRLSLLKNDDRYVCHRAINLYDKDELMVYEDDYLRAKISEDKEVIGLVTFAHELSAYVILCVDSDEFYTLGSEVCDLIEVVGNVFDGYEETK
jgi:hypothetical protein